MSLVILTDDDPIEDPAQYGDETAKRRTTLCFLEGSGFRDAIREDERRRILMSERGRHRASIECLEMVHECISQWGCGGGTPMDDFIFFITCRASGIDSIGQLRELTTVRRATAHAIALE